MTSTQQRAKLQNQIWQIANEVRGSVDGWDNAVAESFFKSLKSDLIYQNIFYTKKQAKQEIFKYI